jgi:hypothetical protein
LKLIWTAYSLTKTWSRLAATVNASGPELRVLRLESSYFGLRADKMLKYPGSFGRVTLHLNYCTYLHLLDVLYSLRLLLLFRELALLLAKLDYSSDTGK